MNKIKICFVTTICGTLKTYILEFAKYLHETGEFAVSFLSSPDAKFQAALPEYISFFEVPMRRGINLDGVRASRMMYRIFLAQRFDIVQYTTLNASSYASVAAKRAGIPVRLYCQWGLRYIGFSGYKRELFKQLEKRVCRASTWIEPDSLGNLQMSRAEGLYPEDFGSIVWNGSACGVSLEEYDAARREEYRAEIREKHQLPKDAFVFGFAARIIRDKGINELLGAYRKLHAENQTTCLMILGNVESEEGIDQELFAWAKQEESVVFCGRTNELAKYLSAMDCFVLPSYREGFGMTILYAESMKTPVIVSNIPGAADAMRDRETGLTVEKGSTESLYAAMSELLSAPEMAARFGENGRRFVEEHYERQKLFAYLAEDRKQLVRKGKS